MTPNSLGRKTRFGPKLDHPLTHKPEYIICYEIGPLIEVQILNFWKPRSYPKHPISPIKIIHFELKSCENMLMIEENKLEITYQCFGEERLFEKSPLIFLEFWKKWKVTENIFLIYPFQTPCADRTKWAAAAQPFLCTAVIYFSILAITFSKDVQIAIYLAS